MQWMSEAGGLNRLVTYSSLTWIVLTWICLIIFKILYPGCIHFFVPMKYLTMVLKKEM